MGTSIKSFTQLALQKAIGFKSYLLLFSIFKIVKIKSYEPGFTHFLSLIENKGIILDVGANIGITAIPMARKFNAARIYAFEPISHNFNNLNRVIKLFGVKNVTSQKVALGEFTAEVEMVTPVQGGVIKQGLSKINDHDTPGRLEKVKIINLDSIPFKGKVTAIKIDVEGHELQVLKGAGKILSKDKPIIYCELWDSIRAEVVAYMQTYGYKSYIFDESLNKLVLYTTQEDCNFFFLK